VAVDGVLVPDPSGILPGRGAWVHPFDGCIDASVQRKTFGRALRLEAAPDPAALLLLRGSRSGAPDEQADRTMDN
jgi:predicted RNA-binding protein YlxR (DUF448 family)